ncbi:MAG: caspase family protein [Cytophagales bacterium]|nr:caspase family protein [Cytophagales bacterium]
MSRKAIVIGIDYYQNFDSLHSCELDAQGMSEVLSFDGNRKKDRNFQVDTYVANSPETALNKKDLGQIIKEFLEEPREVSLLYFSGHGFINSLGGYLNTSENLEGEDGYSMDDLLKLVNRSKALSTIVILDCCYAGKLGDDQTSSGYSQLKEGVTILAASSRGQVSRAKKGQRSIFTDLVIDAMNGSASNILGEITPGSLYAHIDKSLGKNVQRPIFKTNVRRFTVLRKVASQITKEQLRKLPILFKDSNTHFKLDPSFEPDIANVPGFEDWTPDKENVRTFKLLQKFNRIDLVVPSGAKHMFFAAINKKKCKLTPLGKFYRHLASKNMI